jgi:hypothetical protein
MKKKKKIKTRAKRRSLPSVLKQGRSSLEKDMVHEIPSDFMSVSDFLNEYSDIIAECFRCPNMCITEAYADGRDQFSGWRLENEA